MSATTPPTPAAVAQHIAAAAFGSYDDSLDWYTTAAANDATVTVSVTAYDADQTPHGDPKVYRITVEAQNAGAA